MEQLLEMDHFAKRVARQNVLVQALWLESGLGALQHMVTKAFNLAGSKTEKRAATIKDPDYDLYRPRLG